MIDCSIQMERSWGHAWKCDVETKITPMQLCKFENDHEENKNIPVSRLPEIYLNHSFSSYSIDKKKTCIKLTQ